jgi:hypothetical protein
VSLTIDGLDMFTFSDLKNPTNGRPRFSHYLIAPAKHLDISGWQHDLKKSSPFQGVDFKDSLLARTNRDAALLVSNPKVGTLTVCYHIVWNDDGPSAGSTGKGDTPSAREGKGSDTGFGPPSRFRVIKRTIGVLREVVSIRYRK